MEFKSFIEMVKSRKGESVCMPVDELNKLIKNSEEVRITDEGDIELKYKDTRAKISLNNGPGICISEVKEVANYDPYTKLKKENIYISPKKGDL